jgi:hypothetical protein
MSLSVRSPIIPSIFMCSIGLKESTLLLFALQLARVGNGNGLRGGAAGGADLLDGLDDVKTLDDLTENDVLAVQPGGLDGADEELGAVGTWFPY